MSTWDSSPRARHATLPHAEPHLPATGEAAAHAQMHAPAHELVGGAVGGLGGRVDLRGAGARAAYAKHGAHAAPEAATAQTPDEVARASASGPNGARAVATAPQTRVIDGVTIQGPAGVTVAAMDEAAAVVQSEIGHNAYAQKNMAKSKVTLVVMPAETKMTDMPEFAALEGQHTFDGRDWSGVRGMGGIPVAGGGYGVAVGEETLDRSVKSSLSAYPKGYSVAAHEFAHVLHDKGLTPDQQKQVDALFAARNGADPGNKGKTWTDDYASSNAHEYLAQAVCAFQGKNTGQGNNGREWLKAHDPQMYGFLVGLFEHEEDASGKDRGAIPGTPEAGAAGPSAESK